METLNTITALHREPGLEWSLAARTAPGETVSGDQHVVARGDGGVLLAVIDGLGHGEAATQAARGAAEVLIGHPGVHPIELVQRCHAALRQTRGAAMTIVALSSRDHVATAVGVGNVETVFVHAGGHGRDSRESVLLRNGVVGYQLPALQPNQVQLAPGDVIVFATDGVRDDFGDNLTASEPLPVLVDRLLTQKFRGNDDALVLACKILAPDEK